MQKLALNRAIIVNKSLFTSQIYICNIQTLVNDKNISKAIVNNCLTWFSKCEHWRPKILNQDALNKRKPNV